ncbi:MAG: NifU family protein [Clostridiales bacterium]|nr:NifU family protein [Clostridiales bacterium]
MEQYINEVLKPRLQGDGGDVRFVSLEGEKLTLSFQGECSKCLILHRCVDWIREQIRRELDVDVTIEAVRNKPYFWDN